MKKIACLLLVCFIIPLFSFLNTGCASIQNLDNMVVKNWSSYSAIGAGFVSSNSNSGVAYADEENTEPKLIGIKDDGTYEPILFQDKNGKDNKQQLYLRSFIPLENFTLLTYSTIKQSYISNEYSNYKGMQGYLLDNKTGKIYNLSSLLTDLYFTSQASNRFLSQGESSNAIYGTARGHGDSGTFIYKISIEAGLLKAERIVDVSKLDSFYYFAVDNFGNIFSSDLKFYIDSNNKLHNLDLPEDDDTFYKGIDGLFHTKNYVFTAEGTWEKDSVGSLDALLCYDGGDIKYTYFLGKYGNSSYYFKEDHRLVKITEAEGSFEYEFINLEDYEDLSFSKRDKIFANNRLYFMDSNEVYYVSIFDGKKTTINNDYAFYKIWTDGKSNVCFLAIDTNLNNVHGIINADDSVTIGITEAPKYVIYIKPIN